VRREEIKSPLSSLPRRVEGELGEAGMSESQSRWRRSPLILGPLVGWLVGMLWWTGLMGAFGPSVVVTNGGEHTITVASRLVYAPLVAIPWAAIGLLVGATNAMLRGYWVPIAAFLGTLGGGVYSIAISPFDGWLAITMSIACISGTFIGLVVGVPPRIMLGWLKGWEDSLLR
jgi:hypothetical protein